MKFLQKATLAAAVAAAPFAAQALQPIADDELGGVTGQAGVTIEIDIDSAGISVGEVEYTDTKGTGPSAGNSGGGSVVLQNITVKNVTDLTQTIDVDSQGNLLMTMSGVDGMEIAIGDTAADATGQHSALALKSESGAVAEVINNIDMTLDLGNSTTTIVNLAQSGNSEATGLPTDAQGGSVAIKANASVEITDMNLGLFGYTQAQAATQSGWAFDAASSTSFADQQTAAVATATSAANTAGTTLTASQGALNGLTDVSATFNADGTVNELTVAGSVVAVADLDPATQANIINAVNQVSADATAKTNADAAVVNAGQAVARANGSAIQVGGLKFYGTGGEGTKATIEQTIWAKGGTAAQGGGVYIAIGQIQGTLEVGSLAMGGSSIGSLKVSDINLSGMTQRIYGH